MNARAVRVAIALALSTLFVAGIEIDKHHYTAHRLPARIIAGIVAWMLLGLVALLLMTAVAWIGRRLHADDDGALPGGTVSWVLSLALGAIPVVRSNLNDARVWNTEHVVAAIIAWLLVALAARTVLLFLSTGWRQVRRRQGQS